MSAQSAASSAAQTTQESPDHGNAAAQARLTGQAYRVTQDGLQLHRLDDGELEPMAAQVDAGQFVRGLTEPPDAPDDHAFVQTAAEQLGWVEDAGLEEADASLGTDREGDTDVVAGGCGDGAEPEIGVDEADDLVLVHGDFAVLDAPDGAEVGALEPMDMVAVLSEDGGWSEVRRPGGVEPLAGWVSGLSGAEVDTDGPVEGETLATDGTWVGGFTISTRHAGFTQTADGAEGPRGNAEEITGGEMFTAGEEVWVLHEGGEQVLGGPEGDRVYARSRAGVAGWVPASWIGDVEGEAELGTVGLAEELAATHPNGISVAFVAHYAHEGSQFGTFLVEGEAWARAQGAVAIQGGSMVTGGVTLITHKDEMVSALATIQEALRDEDGNIPDFARVAHIGIFAHGSAADASGWGGLNTDDEDWVQDGNLRLDDLAGFARTLTAFSTSDLELSLFACSTGLTRTDGVDQADRWTPWTDPWATEDLEMTRRGGEGSFADEMADSLVEAGAEDAQVMGHHTLGPTLRSGFATLFSDDENGGVDVFPWVVEPLSEWFVLPDPRTEERAPTPVTELAMDLGGVSQDDILRDLWEFFRDTVAGDRELAGRQTSDPELFRLEMRQLMLGWAEDRQMDWGIFVGEFRHALSYDAYAFSDWPGTNGNAFEPRVPAGAALEPLGEVGVTDWGQRWFKVAFEVEGARHEGWLPEDRMERVPVEG